MRESFRRSCALTLLAVVAGCAGPRPAATGPRTLPPGSRPMSGEAPPTRGAMRAALLDLCDRVFGDLSDAMVSYIDDPTLEPDRRIAMLRTQIRIGTTVLALTTTNGVESDVVDLYCYLRVTRARLQEKIASGSPDGPALERIEGAVSGPFDRARRLLEQAATAEQVAGVDRAVDEFLAKDSKSDAGLLLRLDDFAALRAATDRIVGPGSDLFSTVEQTRDELQETRASAELMAFALQRLPMLARWQFRLIIEEMLNGPSVGRMLATVHGLSGSVDALAGRVDAAATAAARIESRIGEAVDGLGDPEAPVARTLAEVRSTIAEATALRESLEGTLPALDATLGSARGTIESLRASVAGVDELRTRLKEDGITLDPAAARETAAELAAAAADLKVALGEARAVLSSDDASARLGEIVAASRTATDYLFWRAGLLLLISACLAIVLRVAWVLTARRGKP